MAAANSTIQSASCQLTYGYLPLTIVFDDIIIVVIIIVLDDKTFLNALSHEISLRDSLYLFPLPCPPIIVLLVVITRTVIDTRFHVMYDTFLKCVECSFKERSAIPECRRSNDPWLTVIGVCIRFQSEFTRFSRLYRN